MELAKSTGNESYAWFTKFKIRFCNVIDGKDISKLSPQERVRAGISFVPQTKNVFAGMTVEENLEMGAYLRDENFQNIIEEIYGLFPILREKRNQLVGELSGGQRQQVALRKSIDD